MDTNEMEQGFKSWITLCPTPIYLNLLRFSYCYPELSQSWAFVRPKLYQYNARGPSSHWMNIKFEGIEQI